MARPALHEPFFIKLERQPRPTRDCRAGRGTTCSPKRKKGRTARRRCGGLLVDDGEGPGADTGARKALQREVIEPRVKERGVEDDRDGFLCKFRIPCRQYVVQLRCRTRQGRTAALICSSAWVFDLARLRVWLVLTVLERGRRLASARCPCSIGVANRGEDGRCTAAAS